MDVLNVLKCIGSCGNFPFPALLSATNFSSFCALLCDLGTGHCGLQYLDSLCPLVYGWVWPLGLESGRRVLIERVISQLWPTVARSSWGCVHEWPQCSWVVPYRLQLWKSSSDSISSLSLAWILSLLTLTGSFQYGSQSYKSVMKQQLQKVSLGQRQYDKTKQNNKKPDQKQKTKPTDSFFFSSLFNMCNTEFSLDLFILVCLNTGLERKELGGIMMPC